MRTRSHRSPLGGGPLKQILALLTSAAFLSVTLATAGVRAAPEHASDNVATTPTGHNLFEPAVAVSPHDPNLIITAAKDLTAGSTPNQRGHREMVGVYRSVDGGYSFTHSAYLPLIGTTIESDPGLAFDSRGRAYASYVAWDPNDRNKGGVAVARSDDGGLSWPTASLAAANERSPTSCTFADFPSIVTHRHALPGEQPTDHIYVAWNAITSRPCGHELPAENLITLARSDDGGVTWHALGSLPKLAGQAPDSPVISVAPNGTLLVAYSVDTGSTDAHCPDARLDRVRVRRPDKMMVASSVDEGAHWTIAEAHPGTCAPVSVFLPEPVAPMESLSGALYNLPSSTNVAANPVTGTRIGVASVADSNGGWTVDVTRSSDGTTWTPGGRPHRLPVEMLEFPRVATAPDGTLYLLYISEFPGSVLLAKMAVSVDDGLSWGSPIVLSSLPGEATSPFTFYGAFLFIGDYVGISVGPDGVVHPVWTDTRPTNRSTKIYTAHLRP